jgi:magnesium transporter
MNATGRLSRSFAKAYPAEAARVLEARPARDAASFLRELHVAVAAEVLRSMVPACAAECLKAIRPDAAARLIAALPVDGAAIVLRQMEPEGADAIFAVLPDALTGYLRVLLQFGDKTAAAVADPKVFVLPEDITVREAARRVRRHPREARYYLYVIDRDRALTGVVTMRDLMVAPRDVPVGSVMHLTPVTLSAGASLREVVEHVGWRRYHALPVVDEQQRLVGVVRYEVLRALEGEVLRALETPGAVDLAMSIGELYLKGVVGMLAGLMTAARLSGQDQTDADEATTGGAGEGI